MKLQKIGFIILMLSLIIGLSTCITNSIVEKQKDKELAELVYKWQNNKNIKENQSSNYTVTSSEIRYTYKNKLYIVPIYGGTETPVDFGDIENRKFKIQTASGIKAESLPCRYGL